jgi:hypothetical protein
MLADGVTKAWDGYPNDVPQCDDRRSDRAGFFKGDAFADLPKRAEAMREWKHAPHRQQTIGRFKAGDAAIGSWSEHRP